MTLFQRTAQSQTYFECWDHAVKVKILGGMAYFSVVRNKFVGSSNFLLSIALPLRRSHDVGRCNHVITLNLLCRKATQENDELSLLNACEIVLGTLLWVPLTGFALRVVLYKCSMTSTTLQYIEFQLAPILKSAAEAPQFVLSWYDITFTVLQTPAIFYYSTVILPVRVGSTTDEFLLNVALFECEIRITVTLAAMSYQAIVWLIFAYQLYV